MSLSQSLAITNGDLSKIIDYPIALALLSLAAGSVWWLTWKSPKATEEITGDPTSHK
jgi:TctA family transporter